MYNKFVSVVHNVIIIYIYNFRSAATPPPTSPSGATTDAPGEPPSTGARTSGLSQSELWGIIGGCIAFVLVVIIIIVVACICCRKKGSGGASKGKQDNVIYYR